jgi:hypothetical protein
VAVAVCWIAGVPPVPVTVRVYVPRDAPDETVTVKVEDPVAGFGLNVPTAPAGRPPTSRLTDQPKPPVVVMLTV